jgi:hypothetical protein
LRARRPSGGGRDNPVGDRHQAGLFNTRCHPTLTPAENTNLRELKARASRFSATSTLGQVIPGQVILGQVILGQGPSRCSAKPAFDGGARKSGYPGDRLELSGILSRAWSGPDIWRRPKSNPEYRRQFYARKPTARMTSIAIATKTEELAGEPSADRIGLPTFSRE